MTLSIFHIVLVGGGTGGHIFPLEATSRALLKEGFRVTIITDQRGARFLTNSREREVIIVPNLSLSQVSTLHKLIKPYLRQAHIVMGFGGSVTVYPLFLARLMRKKVYIHEANAVMGRANRLLSLVAHRVLTSFQVTHKSFLAGKKRSCIGMPLRESVYAAQTIPYQPKDSTFNIVVIGGSQGSKDLTDIITATVTSLSPEVKSKLQLLQQVRPEDLNKVQQLYQEQDFNYELKPFIDDIAGAIAMSHLVIARSGAGTVFEVLALQRPVWFFPLLSAKDNQQVLNAQAYPVPSASRIFYQHSINFIDLKLLIESYWRGNDLSIMQSSYKQSPSTKSVDSILTMVKQDLGLV